MNGFLSDRFNYGKFSAVELKKRRQRNNPLANCMPGRWQWDFATTFDWQYRQAVHTVCSNVCFLCWVRALLGFGGPLGVGASLGFELQINNFWYTNSNCPCWSCVIGPRRSWDLFCGEDKAAIILGFLISHDGCLLVSHFFVKFLNFEGCWHFIFLICTFLHIY